MKLENKVAVVTGATGGMGTLACRTSCENGAVVYGTDLDLEVGAKLEVDLRNDGLDFTFVRVDVTRLSEIQHLSGLLQDGPGRVDVLYNNAGVVLGKHVLETTEEEWDRVHDVISKGTFLMTREIAPLMPDGGSIVNIASAGGLAGMEGMSAYCSAKASVVLFTKVAAIDLAPRIRVNAICPGAIDTQMPRNFVATMPEEMGKQVWEALANGHLTGRFGRPEEVVAVGLFLASDDASFMTGAALVVDGRLDRQVTAMTGLMQDDYRLTIDHVRKQLARGTGGVVSVEHVGPDGLPVRLPYRELDRQLHRLAHGLRSLGVREGERVGTFLWNTVEHMALFIGVPAYGAVLHTVNVRLHSDQLGYVMNHARDRVVFVSPDLVPALAQVVDRLPYIEHVVVCGDLADVDWSGLPGVTTYDALLDATPEDDYAFPQLQESQAAALCYTSGTTGDPKGVLYSHRSIALHATSLLGADSFALRRGDRVLAVVPMFHVNAWGLPYASVLVDADVVLPGRDVRPAAVARAIEQNRVTVMGGVPTVYSDLLAHVDEAGTDLSSVREAFCGGSAVSLALMRAYQERHGVPIVQAWGMTETSPVCTVSRAPLGVTGDDVWRYRTTQGRALPWVDLRLVADDGQLVAHDGESSGELQVRGPWVAAAYFDTDANDRFDDGWLRTGDVATISPDGYLRIVDRAKDVIKSGGEWISSVELENQLLSHPAVDTVAVISVPDPRWEERPLACVVLRPGATAGSEELRAYLLERVARWWVPERIVFMPEIPRTGVGKLNKRALRASLASGELLAVATAAG